MLMLITTNTQKLSAIRPNIVNILITAVSKIGLCPKDNLQGTFYSFRIYIVLLLMFYGLCSCCLK